MRLTGTTARGVRLPIISQGDDLAQIVTDSVLNCCESERIQLGDHDVIGVTEAIVAKAQGNYADITDVAADIRKKFPGGTVGLVFPIFSRNRFYNILKGIAAGADKVYILMQCPSDEVGNPIMDINRIDDLEEALGKGPVSGEKFLELTHNFRHPFTEMDYISLYKNVGNNVEVFVSNDPRDILKLTSEVLVCEIHARMRTKARLLKAGAKTVYTLSDVLSTPNAGGGYNADYGVLGSNLATETKLKLFPRDCGTFVEKLRALFLEKTGKNLEILVYGDGAFKDPLCGIWELADPVVAPGFTENLGGQPNEIKLKYVAENVFSHLSGADKTKAVHDMIKTKEQNKKTYSEGTTPRKYADLLGSLCDLMSGSGDKGTPVILIQGYFDNYATD
ncbi:MAG: coenzyme F420-0:L-glutamate ligase [Clostridiales bacterium]|jgi:F420-0:gamma-glutamyl ligase|nr:coenzyme F420-0:L-glutamate ligase [Clostridiales bacterium]